MMWRTGFLPAAALACGAFLWSCGKAVEPPPRSALVEGNAASAAPVVPSEPDRGILQDPAQYQPATFTPPPSKAKEGGPAEAAGSKTASDAGGSARRFALDALEMLQSSRFSPVLEMIDADQTKLLREDNAAILRTQETAEAFERTLKDKLGADAIEKANDQVKKTIADSLQVEMSDADTATVTPNILLGLLGPAAGGPVLKLAKVSGEWRFELAAPLTSEDVARIAEYHQGLQMGIQQANAMVEQGQLDMEQVMAMVAAFGQASPPGTTQPASGPAAGQEPKPADGKRPAP